MILICEGPCSGGLFGTAPEPAAGIGLESSPDAVLEVLAGAIDARPTRSPAPRSGVTLETSLEVVRRLLAG